MYVSWSLIFFSSLSPVIYISSFISMNSMLRLFGILIERDYGTHIGNLDNFLSHEEQRNLNKIDDANIEP